MPRSKIGRIIAGRILLDMRALVLKKNELEKEFFKHRRKLCQTNSRTTLNSANWEDWKRLSMEHDELKDLISDINKRHRALRKLKFEL